MKYLIALLFAVLIFCDVYRIGLSFGPGLSVKNFVLYLAAMVFMLRMVVQGGFRFTLPRLHSAFGVLIVYATLSVLLLILIVKMPGYHALPGVIALKSNLVDHFLFFAVCYYGVQSTEDTLRMLRLLMGVVVVASAITVINGAGIASIGAMEIGDNGRVEGVLGEPNQYAAFLATMIPPLIAMFATSRSRLVKAFWMGGVLLSLVAMVMTVSRGGILALFASSAWAMFYFRRDLPVGKIMVAGAVALVAVVIFAAASGEYGTLLEERLIGQTFVNNGDMSSGRSEIWETAINRMMEHPWSLLTGFGWYAYESMGFRFITHNSYLLYWFNLGLPGLIAFIVLLTQVFRTSVKATAVASSDVRPHLMGLTVGVVGLVVAVFFVNLFNPWSYIWSLFGLGARLAVNELANAKQQAQTSPAPATVAPARKPVRYGWSADSGGGGRVARG